MKAIVYTKYGSPGVLQIKELEKPVPKENELLIRVYASTVNRTDCAMVSGKPFIIRFFIGLLKPKKLFREPILQDILKRLVKILHPLKKGIKSLDLMTAA